MNKKKKYTFEDWKNGIIDKDFKEHKIKDFEYNKVRDSGWIPQELYHQGFMNVEESRKIDEAQEEAYYTALDISVETYFETFKRSLSRALEPRNLLTHKIKSLKSNIQNAPDFLLELLYKNHWNRSGIDYSKCMMLSDPEMQKYKGKMTINFTEFNFSEGEYGYVEFRPPHKSQNKAHNPLYDLTVTYRFLEKIKTLKEQILSDNSQSKNSNYGTHQENRDWVINTFKLLKSGNYPDDEELNKDLIKQEIKSVKGRGLSENKVAKQVVILYSYKFNGKSISKDQVKGFAVYKNR